MDWQAAKDWVIWVFSESYLGRVQRWDYLKQRLMLLAAGLTLGLGMFLLMVAGSTLVLAVYMVAAIPLWFVLFFRGMTLDIQRLHDMDLSGWWLLLVIGLSFIPAIGILAGFVALVVFFLVPGTPGANRFGMVAVDVAAPVVKREVPPVSKSFAQLVQAQPVAKKKRVKAWAKPVKKSAAKAKKKGRA